jgi:hypothetical protein
MALERIQIAAAAARRRRRQHGAASIPDVALQKVGGAWLVVEGNTERPDGYFQMDGGKIAIVEGAASGLPISLDGPLLVGV